MMTRSNFCLAAKTSRPQRWNVGLWICPLVLFSSSLMADTIKSQVIPREECKYYDEEVIVTDPHLDDKTKERLDKALEKLTEAVEADVTPITTAFDKIGPGKQNPDVHIIYACKDKGGKFHRVDVKLGDDDVYWSPRNPDRASQQEAIRAHRPKGTCCEETPPPKTTGGRSLFWTAVRIILLGPASPFFSKKDAPPPPTKFRNHEVQLNLFGLGGFGHGEVNETETRTVTETETVSTTTFTTETTLKDLPGKPGLTPVDVVVPTKTTKKETVKKNETVTRNRAAIQGGFGGMGADAKVFVTQNIGLGLQGDWLDGDGSIGTFFGTVTARIPVTDSDAPYWLGGAGLQCGDKTRAAGELGIGIEHRFTPSVGMFADASWMFASHENAAVFRVGASLSFGPEEELPPPSKK